MDMENNKKRSLIKRVCFTLFLLFNVTTFFSQKSLSDSAIERDFQLHFFENYNKQIPTLINQANILKFSYGKASYLYAEGELKHPQDYKKQNGFNFQTASLAPLENTNWTLYGSLEYLNTRNEGVETNLSYEIYDYNSPYYFFQKKTGFWNHQNYNFSVISANKISPKLSLGAQLNYSTNFYYRKSDTRNDKQSLTMQGKFSGTYKIAENHFLSASLGTSFFKKQSNFVNKFKENKTDMIYKIYFNTGLGSYRKDFSDENQSPSANKIIYQAQLHWGCKKQDYDIAILSSTKFGEEKWTDRRVFRVAENNILSRYQIFNQNISLFFNKNTNKNQISFNITGSYLKGEGRIKERNSDKYNFNFITTQYDFKAIGDILFTKKTLNGLGFNIAYINKKQQDNNYVYQLNNQHIQSEIHFGFNRKVSNKLSVFDKVKGSYKYALKVKHEPFVAKNIFVDWIGNPISAYMSANSLGIYNDVGFTLELGNSSFLELGMINSYQCITNKSKIATSLKNKDYLQFVLDFNIYF